MSSIRPCEWVFPGHPDRLADAMAEILVNSQTRLLPKGYAGVDVAVHQDRVYLTGRYCLRDGYGSPTLPFFLEQVWCSAGYRKNSHWKRGPEDIAISGNLQFDNMHEGEAESRIYSDQYCTVTGYANNISGTQFMPPEHWLARQLALNLFQEVRGPLDLCPNGKVGLELEENAQGSGTSYRLRSVSVSLLALPEVGELSLRMALEKQVCRLIEQGNDAFGLERTPLRECGIFLDDSAGHLLVGLNGGSGVSGRKLALDFYGPRVPIGGSSLWGKDWNRPEKAGALIAREVALQVVKTGLVTEATVWLNIKPGDTEFTIGRIETPQGNFTLAHWTAFGLGGINLRIDQFSGKEDFPFIHSPDSVCWGLHYE